MKHPEIKWSFLASQVSRNAGWNMTDLVTNSYEPLFSKKVAALLFLTYERANWFIFQDAYPQLLLYEYSKQYDKPLFNLLRHLNISVFMENEWFTFWAQQNGHRLITAQIINEQNVIQKPIVDKPFFKQNVFHRFPYLFQEILHLNSVLFPTLSGHLYGLFIKKFTDVSSRITIGKQLASILFHPNLHPKLLTFAKEITPTGMREEYEQFLPKKMIRSNTLTSIYPTIHHKTGNGGDWFLELGKNIPLDWWLEEKIKPKNIHKPFYRKRRFIQMLSKIIN